MYSLSGYFDFDRNFTSDDLSFRNKKTESFHMETTFFHVGVTLIPFLSRHIYMQKVLYPHILLYYVFIVRARYEVMKSESGNVYVCFPIREETSHPIPVSGQANPLPIQLRYNPLLHPPPSSLCTSSSSPPRCMFPLPYSLTFRYPHLSFATPPSPLAYECID